LHAGGASYPSGHVANAVLIWGLLWFAAQHDAVPAQLRRVLGVVRWFGPVCIVLGMGMLDYHWVTDFVAGGCVGVVLLCAVTAPLWTVLAARLDALLARAKTGVT
jgi:membrane-associated phospholipid phosphatase